MLRDKCLERATNNRLNLGDCRYPYTP